MMLNVNPFVFYYFLDQKTIRDHQDSIRSNNASKIKVHSFPGVKNTYSLKNNINLP